MKKILTTCLILMAIIFSANTSIQATKPFEGVVTYKITYPGSKFTESQLAMFPKILTVTIKGPKSKTEIATGMGIQTEITDYINKTKFRLINMGGQKFAVKTTAEEIENEIAKSPKPTIELSGDQKMIAGYACNKATITVEENATKNTYEIYYTRELGGKQANFDNPLYKDIDGILLEFSLKTPQFMMKFTAASVEKKNISAKEFEIPSDYTLTTQEELKSKFGGME